jgi:hypothetical protein
VNLRKLANGKPCILCGAEGTTVLAHLNIAGHFGRGIKAADWPWGVWLCHSCHDYVDREGKGDWKTKFRALGQQQIVYRERGIIVLRNPEGSTWNV